MNMVAAGVDAGVGVGVKGGKSPFDGLGALDGVDPTLDVKTRDMIASKLGDVADGDGNVGGGEGGSPREGRRLEEVDEAKALD